MVVALFWVFAPTLQQAWMPAQVVAPLGTTAEVSAAAGAEHAAKTPALDDQCRPGVALRAGEPFQINWGCWDTCDAVASLWMAGTLSSFTNTSRYDSEERLLQNTNWTAYHMQ